MEEFNLDETLIEFTSKEFESTKWTIRDAVEGVQIFGGIGSGKTSGSGRMLALKYLNAGFGGLVLTAKPDERKLWEEYCALTNRTQDLLILEPNGKHYFNFLQYESENKDGKISYTENILQVLKTVIKASDEKDKGQSDDAFWESALDMLITHTIDLCLLAYDSLSIEKMYEIVQGAPTARTLPDGNDIFDAAFKAAQDTVNKKIQEWKESLSEAEQERFAEDEYLLYKEAQNSIPQVRTLGFVEQFFFQNYKALSDKTRSIVDFSFSGFLFRLLKDPVYSLFCQHSYTLSPPDSLIGKIIILDLPVKTYHKVGRDIQIMFKYIWQRTMEKRNVELNNRPVFLWADEAQNFIHEYDAEYQATARSSIIATVYISQNIPNYYANMGGQKSEYRVKSFLGTLATKIFHANADLETNRYSSELIGEAFRQNETQTTNTQAGAISVSVALSKVLDKCVRPEEFASLKNGSKRNNSIVEAYVHRQGNGFSNGKNWRKAYFNQ